MFTKIAAGVLAAVAVAGVGIYASLSDDKSPCGRCTQQSATVCPISEESPSCCMASTECSAAAPTESLAACMSAAVLAPASSAKQPAARPCCAE